MRTSRILVVVGWAALAVPTVSAQEAPTPTPIQIGETVTDFLAQSNDSLQDGSRYKTFVLQGAADDSITIVMSSRDFNAHLILSDAEDSVLNNDANSGGDCNAHVTHVLPTTGTYYIFANTEARAELGQFQLQVARGFQPPPSATPCRGFVNPEGLLAVGDSVTGRLDTDDLVLADTSRFETWALTGTAGVTFTIDLVSTDFDARLLLVRGFAEVLGANDDGGMGCNARIGATANDMRPLRVVVIARPAGAGGSYLLRVTEGEQPLMESDTCDPPGPRHDHDGA